MTNTTLMIDNARELIDTIEQRGEELADAVRAEQQLEDGRALAKSAAVRRIMQTLNEETGKAHSASSAEKIVESDEGYAAYRVAQANAVVEKQRAFARYEAAKLRARLAVSLTEAVVGGTAA